MNKGQEILEKGEALNITCTITLRNVEHQQICINPNDFIDRVVKLAACALEGVLYVEKRD